MARVNVETRALAEGRFFNLMRDLGMTRAEAIGTLVLFWHDSQERGIWKGSKEALLRFVPFSPDDRKAIFDALITHEYVSLCDDGEYVIHGNRKHIEALEERKEAASKGGVASGRARLGKKRKNSNVIKSNEALASADEAPASNFEANSIQFNSIQSNTIQDKETKTPSQQAARFDFEPLYQKYPRKVGKQEGIKRAKVQIKTPEDYDALSIAIDRYANYCKVQGTDPKYIKHFSTFMSAWRDWLDPATGTTDSPGSGIDWNYVFEEGA